MSDSGIEFSVLLYLYTMFQCGRASNGVALAEFHARVHSGVVSAGDSREQSFLASHERHPIRLLPRRALNLHYCSIINAVPDWTLAQTFLSCGVVGFGPLESFTSVLVDEIGG